MAQKLRGPTQIPWSDLNYIWHRMFHNLPKTTAKISRSHFYFLMIYGFHSQTHNPVLYLGERCRWFRSVLSQAEDRNVH
jgi:hypothetical protein